MKVYGHPMSTCTRKVLMTLAETNTPYEFTLVDFAKGEHKQEPHTARQPFGQVPAIDDDGFAMYESRAISRYINEKVGGALIPNDLRARAVMEQWISVESANFTGPAMKFVYHYIFQRKQDDAVLTAATESLQKALGIMEKQLGATPFIAGQTFTLADICFMPYIDYVMATPAKELFTPYPHVLAWWNQISERPTWKKATGKA